MEWFNVGKIVNTHGLRGEVRVMSVTDFPEERYQVGNYLYLFMDGVAKPTKLKIASHRVHKNFNLLTFENYPNINLVEPFKGGMLKVNEEQLLELEENEYYFHEIIGCQVVTTDGRELGEVKEILETGANDVWIVRGKGKEVLIPYIADIVIEIDLEEAKITIEPMEGLLD